MTERLPFNFLWQIAPRIKMQSRLHRLGVKVELPQRTRYAQFFAMNDTQLPRLIAWVKLDRALAGSLEKEADEQHPFARWLVEQHTWDLWTIATGWTLYWRHLMEPRLRPLHRAWRARHPADPLLDQLLSPSRGWLLWDHQLQLLAQLSAAPTKIPAHLPARLRANDAAVLRWLERARLPNGTALKEVLVTRLRPMESATTAFPAGIAARLHAAIRSDEARQPLSLVSVP
jgi:hypothetical protein